MQASERLINSSGYRTTFLQCIMEYCYRRITQNRDYIIAKNELGDMVFVDKESCTFYDL